MSYQKPGYLKPDFDYDIFISYAHNDDVEYSGEKWVTKLEEELRKRVTEKLADEPAFWRDSDIGGNDVFDEKIANRLAGAAALLTIVSESFLNSPYCHKELEEFCRNAERKMGLKVGEKLRIFKVFKSEVDRQDLPKEFDGTEQYLFYGKDLRDTYRPFMGGAHITSFYKVLNDLAIDIAETLKVMRQVTKRDTPAPPPPAPATGAATVYLAETSEDQDEARDSIKRELKEHNINIFPQGTLPVRGSQFEPVVRECLAKADLSIHIFGEKAGWIPEGQQRPHTWLQHDLAMQRNKDPDFRRILWVPAALDSAEECQRDYLQRLLNDGPTQRGAVLLRHRLEELKSEMNTALKDIKRRKIDPPAVAPPEPGPGQSATKKIYLICDRQDLENPVFRKLREYLFDQGLEPRLARPGNNAKEAHKNHEMLLQYADAYLIYYGAASGEWVETKLDDFLRLNCKRKSPVLAKAIYIAPPLDAEKRDFRSNDAKPMGGGPDFDPNAIAEFLGALKRA